MHPTTSRNEASQVSRPSESVSSQSRVANVYIVLVDAVTLQSELEPYVEFFVTRAVVPDYVCYFDTALMVLKYVYASPVILYQIHFGANVCYLINIIFFPH